MHSNKFYDELEWSFYKIHERRKEMQAWILSAKCWTKLTILNQKFTLKPFY